MVLAVVLAGGVAVFGTQSAQAQSTYVVNSTGDADDANPGDGTCETSEGECTFRAALQEAAESTAIDTVSFADIPTGGILGGDFATIGLTGDQPTIADAYVDGTTAPGYPSDMGGPIVGLDGSGLDGNIQQGIELDDGGAQGIEAISVFNAPDDGIADFEGNTKIINCWVGVRPNGEIASNAQNPDDNDLAGIYLGRDNAEVRGNLVAGHSCENAVPGNTCSAIHVDGLNITLKGNMVGVGPNGETDAVYANDGTGIWVEDVDEGQVDIGYGYDEEIAGDPSPLAGGMGNIVAQSDSIGIVIADTTGTAVRGNSIYGNGIAGLRIDGPYDGNDEGDTDEGINRGQNFPVIASVSGCDDSGRTTTVDVSYQVRSNADSANASNYGDEGLKVDFYTTDSGEDQGRTYLGTDTYAAADAGSVVTTTLSAEGVSCSDAFVATATDADNNTSQFNASTVLPVELASFAGQQIDETSVELVWQTATEQNNAGFRVEQAARGGDWTQVAFVDGAGTTTEAQTYRLTVEDLEPGTHRFRLTQVDVDGSTQTVDAVTVRLGMQEALRVSAPSPNPVRTGATLRFAVKQPAETTVSVYNVLGQRVATLYRGTPAAEETKAVTVSADALPSGAYFLRVTSGEHTETRRFTVVR
jgi:CSLREA domain-containing protein